jgi:hypothetical protein
VRDAFSGILKRASSHAASVLDSGEGSGANLIQAVFYPRPQRGERHRLVDRLLQNRCYFRRSLLRNATSCEETTRKTP